jgi:hypothetical protein
MEPLKTEYERSDVYKGGVDRHLSQVSLFKFGLPQIGQMGDNIWIVFCVHCMHHRVPETPQPPQVGGNNQSIASQSN